MAPDPTALPAVFGEWGNKFDLLNVGIHMHLLPTGKLLYWGRRKVPGDPTFKSLNEDFCSTFLLDPTTCTSVPTAKPPAGLDGNGVNLFCSGHSFLPDGRLLVVGGHLFDGQGIDQACLYDAGLDKWTALPRMNKGRWYPSALTLPDGSVLTISGSFAEDGRTPTNPNPQILRSNAWANTMNFQSLQLYPRLHIEPKKGQVFMAGPQDQSFFLDTTGDGSWTPVGRPRTAAMRDYAPSVMYESGKVIFIGGGLDARTQLPTNITEIINLNDPDPQWQVTNPMRFRRRQHNATVLADGTVLVTGGTQGLPDNPPWLAFDNTNQGAPIHMAELWDPTTKLWAPMAEESVDRCYHSTAVLLPDARVLSAGGGEYVPNDPKRPNLPNLPANTHTDAQMFKPPYLFKGPQPTIVTPRPGGEITEITYGGNFNITVGAGNTISKVSFVRLSSVTHSCNQNQLFLWLKFDPPGSSSIINVKAPANSNIAPPGHYMLFAINQNGVPSVAPIFRISGPPKKNLMAQRMATAESVHVDLAALDKNMETDQTKPPVVVGLTPHCPYGLGACWGGAFSALQQLSDVEVVRPLPDADDSIAFVYLQRDVLPDLEVWRDQFAKVANGSYTMRGLEMTLSGKVSKELDTLTLTSAAGGLKVVLAPLQAADKIQWDLKAYTSRPMSSAEASAFEDLSKTVAAHSGGATVQVTGPLKKKGADFYLAVREFEPPLLQE